MKKMCLLLLGCLTWSAIVEAAPLGTQFTYQGRLDQNGQPTTNGLYGMIFLLYAVSDGGSFIATNLLAVPVTNGLFTATLDFGATPFSGDARWLEIGVNTNTASPLPSYLTFLPRTRLTPTPNAIYASIAGSVANRAIQTGQLGTVSAPLPGQILGYNGTSLEWQSAGVGPSPWLLNGANTYFNGGNVGIGTAVPTAPFHLNSTGTVSSVLAALLEPNLSNGAFDQIYLGRTPAANGCATFTYTYAATNTALSLLSLGLYDNSYTLNLRGNGNVGIGTANPQAALDIAGNWDGGRPALQLRGEKPTIKFTADPASGNQEWLLHLGSDGPGNLEFLRKDSFIYSPVLILAANENVGVGTANPQAKLDVRGTTRTCVLEITGGCDVAEPFLMKEEFIEKGSVVVIDEEHPGRLKLSTRAYDTQVAGIVSGANGIHPGIALKQEGTLDQGQNVALTGRVYVKADASHGAIKPGDLLTTSDLPGHAMKVTDHARAQGAILGKAMTSLKEGTGFVQVLVTLQ